MYVEENITFGRKKKEMTSDWESESNLIYVTNISLQKFQIKHIFQFS
jgi:hypothetical protein